MEFLAQETGRAQKHKKKIMHIVVIGASSGVGQEVVKLALKQGHRVRAFARNPQKLSIHHPQLELIAGDATNLSDMQKAIAGTDAVICTLGAPARDKSGVRSQGTHNIVKAMPGGGRLVVLSSLGIGESEAILPGFVKYIVFPFFLKNAMKDHAQQEELVKASSLEYTIVRPGNLNDQPPTGNFQAEFPMDRKTVSLKPVSRGDVAAFMLQQLSGSNNIRKAVGIAGR